MAIIAIETAGFNLVNYCCGATEVHSAFSGLDECGIGCTDDHHHEEEDTSDCHDHEAPGIHVHHHHHGCMQMAFIQLRPQEKKTLSGHLLPVFLPVIIELFDFGKDEGDAFVVADSSIPITPPKLGRLKLALHSVYLI